jgi:hypothetical protein
MKAKPPPDRRKFTSEGDEVGYLYDKLLYWLYQRANPPRARPYAQRMERILERTDPRQETIFGQECRSLAREAAGDLPGAIDHRENEIRLIRRLHEISRGKPHERFALKGYGPDDLSDRLDLLATLYRDSGNLDKAIEVLRESQKLCQSNGVRFDGEDLLREYLEEREPQVSAPRRARRGKC